MYQILNPSTCAVHCVIIACLLTISRTHLCTAPVFSVYQSGQDHNALVSNSMHVLVHVNPANAGEVKACYIGFSLQAAMGPPNSLK